MSTPWIITALFLAAMLPSCGGGGGGGGGGGDTVVIPDVYEYSLSIDEDDPLTIGPATVDGNDITLGTLAPILGTYAIETGAWTLSADSLVNVSRGGWNEPYGTFTIQILTDIEAVAGGLPTAGSMRISDGTNTISMTVASTGASLSLNGGAAETYTWDELFDLYKDAGEEYWRWESSLSALVVTEVLEEVAFTADTLVDIESNDDTLEDEGSLTYACSVFPGTPPAAVPAQGTHTLGWTDTSGNSSLGPGDDFSWVYYWCWANNTSDDIDQLYLGNVSMLGFLENVDEVGGTDTITAIGFWPEGDAAGGVFYESFYTYTTEETSPGVVVIDTASSLVYNGGYSIMFYTE